MFDFIVVGGGSAGCVMASRLTENPNVKVLLVEAGASHGGIFCKIPLGYGKTFYNPKINWMYETDPIEGLANRRNFWPRGKVLGGSSAINAMVYIRGHRQDFEDWNRQTGGGWSYDDVLPYFRKSENHYGEASKFHGKNGPLNVADVSGEIHSLSREFLKTCDALGYEGTDDFNGAKMEGCGVWPVTTRRGLRESTATAFLYPNMHRKNLEVITNAHVKKIIFDQHRRAQGVEIVKDGEIIRYDCSKEVILCAGAINTPKLLELSGIGDAQLLKKYGISLILDSPMVGRNLQDHLALSYVFKSTVPTLNQSLGTWRGQMMAALHYGLTRKGLLSMSVNQVGGFVRSRPELALPNLQLYFNPISYDTAPSGKKRTVKPDRFPGFLISFNTCRPTSVGEIHIQSNDDLKPPLIKPNYLSTSADIQDVFEGYRVIRQIAATQPLNRFVLDHHLPNRERVDEAGLLEDFRNRASTVYHACGTASMGKDISNSVVDAKLRVHGVSGLRVVDASIFPNVSSGNTNAPTIMVAEKASDILKKDWHL